MIQPNRSEAEQSHPINKQEQCYFLPPIGELNSMLFTVEVVVCLLNSLFCVIAVPGNLLVIFTIWRTSSLHSPSMVLIGCLAVSDLVVGIIAQPCIVVYRAARITGNLGIYCAIGIITELSGWTASGVSFLTVTAIGIERYLALHLHLRYEEKVTNSRVISLFTCFWVFYGLFSSTRFWISMSTYACIVVVIFVFGVTLALSGYFQIFKLVQRHRKQIADDAFAMSRIRGENRPSIDLNKYQRSLVTSGLVVTVYIICYLPLICVLSVYSRVSYTKSIEVAYLLSTAFVFMNSTFNFVIYGWRVKEIREALKGIFNCLSA